MKEIEILENNTSRNTGNESSMNNIKSTVECIPSRLNQAEESISAGENTVDEITHSDISKGESIS